MTHKNDVPPMLVDLFDQANQQSNQNYDRGWPPAERFPLNIPQQQQVEQQVQQQDLYSSRNSLIVTGYGALDRLIHFVCSLTEHQPDANIRLMFGHEPFPSRGVRVSATSRDLVHEAEDYWLERGISLLYSAHVIRAIELLRSGKVQTRYMPGNRRLHAKIYVGDDAVTVGSSNFTEPGMRFQLEANARFDKNKEPKRYAEAMAIAENYWLLGANYNEELIALLEKLLRVVSWEEALARACAELLEGEWANKYLREDYLSDASSLWPSQRQGIAQALYVLSNQGSVLIADATGAGKTRMGIYLVGALTDQVLRDGRMRRGKAAMICPPAVQDNWMRESSLAGVPLETMSQGMLSMASSRHHDHIVESLKRAQILCVDEGHNFLNAKSARTQHLLRNIADHVVLLTATPINKGIADLVRVADLLGADNLAPEIIAAFEKMLGGKEVGQLLSEADAEELRAEIRKFTVRRTKRDLNALVDRDPEHYRDKNGRQCRFPNHRAEVYGLNESVEDRLLAREIRENAGNLYGVTHLIKAIELPEVLRRRGVTEKQYLDGRLNGAKKLAQYIIMSSLRSSRVALYEHIHGTPDACKAFGIKHFSKQTESGNQQRKLIDIQNILPENRLGIALPSWLSDPDKHRAACEHDLKIYNRIGKLVLRMSDAREQAKTELLVGLLERHASLLAFDSRPISLHYLKSLMSTNKEQRVVVATGSDKKGKDAVIKDFAHGATGKRLIGLCSDSLAEGVNLQQASALVHLDMPSVVRIAEQRAGRVDRMDSPHDDIELWWPDDAEEFALSSDERFVERYETVEQLLGSNMPLPENLQKSRHKLSVNELIKEYEATESWDGIDDAFGPVRELMQGTSALVPQDVYEHYRKVQQRVLSRVSLVRARSAWAFFCLSAGGFGAPRWIFVPGMNGEPVTDLTRVSERLRENLGGEVESVALDQNSARILSQLVKRLTIVERRLLSRKKQRALEELEYILEMLIVYASKERQQESVDHLRELQKMLRNPPPDQQPDWDTVAAKWLDMIRPVWFERLSESRNRPLLLKDIRKDLLAQPQQLIKQLEAHFAQFPVLSRPEERIKACIIGVP